MHYIATKYHYEGLWYAYKLIHELLKSAKDEDINRREVYVVYKELCNNIVDVRDDFPRERKASLSNSNRTSPLPFYWKIDLKSHKETTIVSTLMIFIFFMIFNGACSHAMNKIRRNYDLTLIPGVHKCVSCHDIQNVCYIKNRSDQNKSVKKNQAALK